MRHNFRIDPLRWLCGQSNRVDPSFLKGIEYRAIRCRLSLQSLKLFLTVTRLGNIALCLCEALLQRFFFCGGEPNITLKRSDKPSNLSQHFFVGSCDRSLNVL